MKWKIAVAVRLMVLSAVSAASLLIAAEAVAAVACTPLVVGAGAGAEPASPAAAAQQALERNLLALAQAPGDPLSDLLLAKVTCAPVGAVAAWPPRALPAAAGAGVDADALAAIVLHDAEFHGVPATLQRRLERQLLAAATTNAYYAVSLLDPAADTGNGALRDAALKAGAGAPRYTSPFVPALAAALDRYADSGIANRIEAPADGEPIHDDGDLAAAMTLAVEALPGVTAIVSTCKKPQPQHRADCIALAERMLAGSTTLLEATIAAAILDAIATAPGAAPSRRHRAPLEWLRHKAGSAARGFAGYPEPQRLRLRHELRTHGELAAMRLQLRLWGEPATPPPGWEP